MLFFVKVRIDISKLKDLAENLKNGKLDKGNLVSTYCPKEDLTIGLNIWKAENRNDFDKIFKPHKKYYKEVIEITEVVTSEEAKVLLIEKFKNQ